MALSLKFLVSAWMVDVVLAFFSFTSSSLVSCTVSARYRSSSMVSDASLSHVPPPVAGHSHSGPSSLWLPKWFLIKSVPPSFAVLQQTFTQPSLSWLQSPNHPLSKLPLPAAGLLTRPISHCPHPVLLSNDCSIPVRSFLFPPPVSLSLFSPCHLSCMQNTQRSSCCALTHTALSPPFSFQKLANAPLFRFPSLTTHQDLIIVCLCPKRQNETCASC